MNTALRIVLTVSVSTAFVTGSMPLLGWLTSSLNPLAWTISFWLPGIIATFLFFSAVVVAVSSYLSCFVLLVYFLWKKR